MKTTAGRASRALGDTAVWFVIGRQPADASAFSAAEFDRTAGGGESDGQSGVLVGAGAFNFGTSNFMLIGKDIVLPR